MNSIKTAHGSITLPAFMPDATYGSIKAVSFLDAKKAGVKEIVSTTLHIEQKIGSEHIKKFGGIHKFFGWDRPILTDSGGWQVFSLINAKKDLKHNKASEVGCNFLDPLTQKTNLLTPESSIQIQKNLDSDILTVLDFPILGNSTYADRKKCVDINTKWAIRSKKKFEELKNNNHLLGAVIQGGDDFELRKKSAEELLEIDFDIYNFGGMPMYYGETWKTQKENRFHREMLHYVLELIPKHKLKYAMGVGQPIDIAYCVDIGWQLFDTVLPTRNARHGYLYVSAGNGDKSVSYKPEHYLKKIENIFGYDIVHIKSERYKEDSTPLDSNCDCECCSTVSRSYLRYLIRFNEPSGLRLATIHNLRFFSKWMENLRTNVTKKF